MIPMFGAQLPALATAAVVGILLNLILSIGDSNEDSVSNTDDEAKSEVA
jgi:uracil permease